MKTEHRRNRLLARLSSVNEVADFLGVHSNTVRPEEKRRELLDSAEEEGDCYQYYDYMAITAERNTQYTIPAQDVY